MCFFLHYLYIQLWRGGWESKEWIKMRKSIHIISSTNMFPSFQTPTTSFKMLSFTSLWVKRQENTHDSVLHPPNGRPRPPQGPGWNSIYYSNPTELWFHGPLVLVFILQPPLKVKRSLCDQSLRWLRSAVREPSLQAVFSGSTWIGLIFRHKK